MTPNAAKGLGAALALGLAVFATPCRADYDLTFSTTGSPLVGGSAVGATAEFIATGTTLQIILTDTTATISRSQLLTGVFFDLTGASNPTSTSFTTPTTVVTPGNGLFTSPTSFTTSTATTPIDITGSYLFAQTTGGLGTTTGPPATTFNEHYGVSATGDNPLFPGSSFTKGNSSDDYAIFGPGTDLTSNSFKNSFALVQNSVTITITNFQAGTGVTNVVFPFGSAPSGSAAGTYQPPSKPSPEPASLVLVSIGCLAGTVMFRRKAPRSA